MSLFTEKTSELEMTSRDKGCALAVKQRQADAEDVLSLRNSFSRKSIKNRGSLSLSSKGKGMSKTLKRA